MFNAVIIITVIVAILLILVVLIQNSKGGGLSSQFGGSSTNQVIGVKKTTDLLEKITWGLAIAVMALSLTSSMLIDRGGDDFSNPNIDKAQQESIQQTPLPDVSEDAALQLAAPDSTTGN